MAAITNVVALSVIFVIVGTAHCGRFPIVVNRIESNEVGVGDDQYKTDSMEEYFNGLDSDDANYITDVQIDEVQKAQEKIKQDQEIYEVDDRCPKFNGLCSAPVCGSDSDCGTKICCFNGCIQTCADDTSPPIAIDWIPNLQKLTQSSATANTITIPGGCKVSQQQRRNLDLFLKYGHVTKCLCKKDDVVCYVRKRYPWTGSTEDFDQLDNEGLNKEI